jgi:hypothetical protein
VILRDDLVDHQADRAVHMPCDSEWLCVQALHELAGRDAQL